MGLLGVAREDLAPAGCAASRTSKTGLTTGATEYSQGFASVATPATPRASITNPCSTSLEVTRNTYCYVCAAYRCLQASHRRHESSTTAWLSSILSFTVSRVQCLQIP
jgi:hypothetical protein